MPVDIKIIETNIYTLQYCIFNAHEKLMGGMFNKKRITKEVMTMVDRIWRRETNVDMRKLEFIAFSRFIYLHADHRKLSKPAYEKDLFVELALPYRLVRFTLVGSSSCDALKDTILSYLNRVIEIDRTKLFSDTWPGFCHNDTLAKRRSIFDSGIQPGFDVHSPLLTRTARTEFCMINNRKYRARVEEIFLDHKRYELFSQFPEKDKALLAEEFEFISNAVKHLDYGIANNHALMAITEAYFDFDRLKLHLLAVEDEEHEIEFSKDILIADRTIKIVITTETELRFPCIRKVLLREKEEYNLEHVVVVMIEICKRNLLWYFENYNEKSLINEWAKTLKWVPKGYRSLRRARMHYFISVIVRKWKKLLAKKKKDEECSICCDLLEDETRLACKHSFHMQCIMQWKETRGNNATCPICRAKIVIQNKNKKQKLN